MFCHDRVSSGDFYLPRRHFPRIKQDPVDIILSGSVLNFVPHSSLDNSLPLSRDVPSCRKEDATIVYLQRSNRPLVCFLQQLYCPAIIMQISCVKLCSTRNQMNGGEHLSTCFVCHAFVMCICVAQAIVVLFSAAYIA